jgi:diaminopimelate decarboxylase
VPAVALAERFGTPLLVFDEADVHARMREAKATFPRVAYAVKAMTCAALIRTALEEGLDLLCASGGEALTCLRSGAAATRILLHGNAKTDEELTLAVEFRLGWVVVDGQDELERLAAIAERAGVVQPILLRVTPEVAVATHEAIATGHAESKFGTPLDEAPATIRRALEIPGVRLDGLHAHAGSQVLEDQAHAAVLRALVGIAVEAGFEPRILDVGGGMGITYGAERPLTFGAVAASLTSELQRLRSTGLLAGEPELQAEPGRALVGNPAITLYRVLARKRAGGRTLVAVDGGMSDNLRPALYDAHHEIRAVAGGREGPTDVVTVVGRHCESGDVLAPAVELPADLVPGDLLAVAATGAYTYPLASVYNRFGRPAVVGVRDGQATVWCRREEPDDMDRLDVILGTPWAAPAEAATEGGAGS